MQYQGQINEPSEHDVEFVVTRPYAAIPLEPAEQAFHFVATTGIQLAVEGPRFPACRSNGIRLVDFAIRLRIRSWALVIR